MKLKIDGKEVEIQRIAHLPKQKIIRIAPVQGTLITLSDEDYDEKFITYSTQFKNKLKNKLQE